MFLRLLYQKKKMRPTSIAIAANAPKATPIIAPVEIEWFAVVPVEGETAVLVAIDTDNDEGVTDAEAFDGVVAVNVSLARDRT